METLTELDLARSRHPNSPAAGSALESRALARFASFFSSFAPDRVQALLAETYATDIYFNDTLKAVRGLEALGHYLAESAEAVQDCQVRIHETTRTSQGEFLVRWSMMIRFKRFKRGQETWTVGMSHLRFDADGHVSTTRTTGMPPTACSSTSRCWDGRSRR